MPARHCSPDTCKRGCRTSSSLGLHSPAYSTVTEEHESSRPSSTAPSPRQSGLRLADGKGPQLDPLLELAASKYVRIRALNEGGSGFVHLAVERFTGEQVAIKYLPRGSALQGAERELLNLRACAVNPHIIRFKEVRHECTNPALQAAQHTC